MIVCALSKWGDAGLKNSDVFFHHLEPKIFVETKYGVWVGADQGVGPFSYSKALHGSGSSPRRASGHSACRAGVSPNDLVQPSAFLAQREKGSAP